jgi:hypothetical protein
MLMGGGGTEDEKCSLLGHDRINFSFSSQGSESKISNNEIQEVIPCSRLADSEDGSRTLIRNVW